MKRRGPSFITRKTKKSIDYLTLFKCLEQLVEQENELNDKKVYPDEEQSTRKVQQSRGFYKTDARVVSQQDHFSLINRVEYKVPTRQIKHLHRITIFLFFRE